MSDGLSKNVLFFGKQDCDYSNQALTHLSFLGFNVTSVFSKDRQDAIPEDLLLWKGAYIFCFRSYFLLPQSLIDRAEIAAINFHPGPVEYPGSGCINWALYEDAAFYGVTAHLMNENIDNGDVLECRRFPILKQDNVTTLLKLAHLKTFDLLIDFTTGLFLEGKSFLDKKLLASINEKWSGKARKMKEIDILQRIDLSCSREELQRLIRSTHVTNFPLEINFHGYKFILKI